jgi:hypothetical protein
VSAARPLALAALVALTLLGGCAEDVAVPDDIEAYFTLWGALDPTADRQAIRVVPITPVSSGGGPGATPDVDAVVTSTNVQTGETVTWRDSLVTFSDGTTGHVFLADFRPVYDGFYRIEVTRPDGATTSADFQTPPAVEAIRQPTVYDLGVYMPVLWPGAPQVNAITIDYTLQDGDCEEVPFSIAFAGEAEPFEFGWLTTINLREEADRVLQALGDRPHAVLRMRMRAEVASEDWRPPGGVFDPEILVEPGTFSNVERGFGLVGGAYEAAIEWEPEAIALQRTAFETPGFGSCE